MNLDFFAKNFYFSHNIPTIYLNKDGDIIHMYPNDFIHPLNQLLSAFLDLKRNPEYFLFQGICYYGLVCRGDESLILGPIFTFSITDTLLEKYLVNQTLEKDAHDNFKRHLLNIPTMPFHQFIKLLGLVYSSLNNVELDVGQFFFDTEGYPLSVAEQLTANMYSVKDTQNFHNSYHFEQIYLEYIKEGNVTALKRFLKEFGHHLNAGRIAKHELRQAKNIAICAITLMTRSAIAGGMDIEEAYQLGDIYLTQCELLNAISDIGTLQYNATIDFCERVANSKYSAELPPDMMKCMQYVRAHTNQKITVDDIANYMGKSRSYVSKTFKKKLGFNLCDYIIKCKLEEAKALLNYTDLTISEISNYLAFSSQSYFQNLFKKQYGLTPKQYRVSTYS